MQYSDKVLVPVSRRQPKNVDYSRAVPTRQREIWPGPVRGGMLSLCELLVR